MKITIDVTVDTSLNNAWLSWITPSDIKAWNFASEEWCCPRAEIELEEGKDFSYRMEARDGSMGFDFKGTFTIVRPNELIEYVLEDQRKVSILFEQVEGGVKIVESFDPETENSIELQRQGWQCILNNYKKYVEAKS